MGRAEYERHAAPAEPEETAGVDEPGLSAEQADSPGEDVRTHGSAGGEARPEEASDEAPDAAEEDGAEEPGDADAEAIAARAAEPPEELAADLVAAERARDQYLDLLQRERAEFENFRRRANRERGEALDRGAESVVSQLLGVLDNFGFVLDAAEQSEDTQLAKGVSMVHDELVRALEAAGLERVPGAGAPFDPNHHEAMMQVEAEEDIDEPTVVEVLRPGYRFKGRVLRPASVSVAQ